MNRLITVRLATVGDVKRIASMSRELVEHGLPWRWQPDRVRRALRDRSTNVAVASDGSRVVGFGIMLYADAEAHLLLFAVHPAHRRQGVGAAILEWLEAVARTAAIQRVLLECRLANEAARNFYGARGYRELRIVRRMYEGVEDGITLEKWLTADGPAAG